MARLRSRVAHVTIRLGSVSGKEGVMQLVHPTRQLRPHLWWLRPVWRCCRSVVSVWKGPIGCLFVSCAFDCVGESDLLADTGRREA